MGLELILVHLRLSFDLVLELVESHSLLKFVELKLVLVIFSQEVPLLQMFVLLLRGVRVGVWAHALRAPLVGFDHFGAFI